MLRQESWESSKTKKTPQPLKPISTPSDDFSAKFCKSGYLLLGLFKTWLLKNWWFYDVFTWDTARNPYLAQGTQYLGEKQQKEINKKNPTKQNFILDPVLKRKALGIPIKVIKGKKGKSH